MKFAFTLPNMTRLKNVAHEWEADVTGAIQTRMLKRVEALGYDMVLVPEHLVVPSSHVELSGSHYFHAAAAQGYYLGATERMRIGTSITILPLHHPITIAKALSTIDWLSGGRTNVTFAAGWLKEEFDALGVPFHKRGRIMDEYLAAIIELWTKPIASFEGEFVSFRDVVCDPQGAQAPHIPIWLGGDSDPALRRLARFATGWVPFLTQPDELPARLDFIRSLPEFRGGDFDVMYMLAVTFIGEGHVEGAAPVGKEIFSAQEMIDKMGWLQRNGVTIAAHPIPPVEDAEAYADYAQWFMEDIAPHFA